MESWRKETVLAVLLARGHTNVEYAINMTPELYKAFSQYAVSVLKGQQLYTFAALYHCAPTYEAAAEKLAPLGKHEEPVDPDSVRRNAGRARSRLIDMANSRLASNLDKHLSPC